MTTGGTGAIIDIDLGLISLELYLAFQNRVNQDSFLEWARANNKTYESTDFQRRYKIYVDNKLYVQNFATLNPTSTFVVGVNGPFSDLTLDEFSNIYLANSQGICGSGYAFAAIAALESAYTRKYGTAISLSEQNILDCANANGNLGCNGGWPHKVYYYIQDAGGVYSQNDYPYVGTISGDAALKTALLNVGPVATVIAAGQRPFQFYSGGIYRYDPCTTDQYNHHVAIAGYGTENTKNYWIARNSWGESVVHNTQDEKRHSANHMLPDLYATVVKTST
eukprot:gene13620-16029_t